MAAEGTQRVQAALETAGLDREVVALERSSRTAAEAAAALGCDVGQIVKSLVFRDVGSDQTVLVLASGAGRVDESVLNTLLGAEIAQADPEFVRDRTGFSIGGVAPVGHTKAPSAVIIDEALLDHEVLWAAAGAPKAVFRLTPDELRTITDGRVARVR